MAIDLYMNHVSPPANAVRVLLRVLGLEANEKVLDVLKGEQNEPDFLKLNPAHTIPTLVDDGVAIFESRAILTYLINKYKPDSPLYPQDPVKRARVDSILYFEATNLFTALGTIFRAKLMKGVEPSEEAIQGIEEKLNVLIALLGDQPFLAGDHVTLADISLDTYLRRFKVIGVTIPEALEAWSERTSKAVPELAQINQEADDRLVEFMKSVPASLAAAQQK